MRRTATVPTIGESVTTTVRWDVVRASLSANARAIVAHIGRTPLIPLPSPNPAIQIFGKAEWFNPSGSVKDRPAWWIVKAALVAGHLPRLELLDASSGNTGIAYSMLGAVIGFRVTLCMSANVSPERRRMLEAYGARVVETDPLEGSDGAIRRARELAAAEPMRFWYADQYGNPANPEAHYATTAMEIWDQTNGRLTHFVAGLGTTGTLVGTSRKLRSLKPDIRIVGVEPAHALHGIEGLKHLATEIRPAIWDESTVDERRGVSTEEAQDAAKRLAREAGLCAGVSSGAAYAACRHLATQMEHGTLVTVLPDGGTRYLSEGWWTEP